MHRTYTSALLALALVGAANAFPDGGEDPLAREVRELREQVAQLRALRVTDAKLNRVELELLTKQVERIEKSLKELSPRPGPYRSEFTPSTPRAVVRSATIKLDNRLPVTAYVTIDGSVYTVAPLSVRTLPERSAGAVDYSLTADGFGVGPLVRSRVDAGGVLQIRIYDPRFPR